jgi:RNA recognition motif-containing protein
MTKKIYVGNLPFTASEEEIRNLFATHGTVHSVTLISDRDTGRPRGFGFVEMDAETAQTAIDAINGTELGGRTLNVNEARERKGGGRGGRSGGGGGGGRPRRDY